MVDRAEPGERVQHDPKITPKVSIKTLRRFRSDAELQKHLHQVFAGLGVRYVGGNWRND